MPVFTVVTPIEHSKFVMDLLLYETSNQAKIGTSNASEECLLRVLFMMLKCVETKCLSMGEEALFKYLKNGDFVIDCFAEL